MRLCFCGGERRFCCLSISHSCLSLSLSLSPPVIWGQAILSASRPAASDRRLYPDRRKRTKKKKKKKKCKNLLLWGGHVFPPLRVCIYTLCVFQCEVCAFLWCAVDSSEAVKNFTGASQRGGGGGGERESVKKDKGLVGSFLMLTPGGSERRI